LPIPLLPPSPSSPSDSRIGKRTASTSPQISFPTGTTYGVVLVGDLTPAALHGRTDVIVGLEGGRRRRHRRQSWGDEVIPFHLGHISSRGSLEREQWSVVVVVFAGGGGSRGIIGGRWRRPLGGGSSLRVVMV